MSIKYKVFVSYPAGQSAQAEYIAEILENYDISVWLNEWYYLPELPWEETIKQALQESKIILILLEKNALEEDRWFKKEVDMALELRSGTEKQTLIVGLLPGAEKSDIPEKLKESTILDLTSELARRSAVEKFVYSIEPKHQIETMFLKISQHFVSKNYTSVIELLHSQLKEFQGTGKDDIKITANIYDKLAYAYIKLNKPDRALHYYLELKEIVNKHGSEKDKVRLLNNLGFCCVYSGKQEKAIELYLEGLKVCQDIKLGNLETIIYYNLATAYHKQEDDSTALEYYLKAFKKAYEERDYALGTSIIINMAYISLKEQEYAVVYRFYREALRLYLRTHDCDRKTVSDIFGNMAYAKHEMRQYPEAIDLFKSAIEMLENSPENTHPLYGDLYSGIGAAYSEMGDHKRAKENYLKALEIFNKRFGRKHLKVAITLNNLAYQCFKEKSCEQSVEYYKDALEIFLKELGEKHPDTLLVSKNLEKAQKEKTKKIGNSGMVSSVKS